MIYSVEPLNEVTKGEVKAYVFFGELFAKMKKQEYTVDKIDKLIDQIKKCNKRIDDLNNKGDWDSSKEIFKDGLWWHDFVKVVGMSAFIGAGIGMTANKLAELYVKNAIKGLSVFEAIGKVPKITKVVDCIKNGTMITSGAAGALTAMSRNSLEKTNNKICIKAYGNLKKDNEKALEWLESKKKELKEGKKTSKNESSIFESVELI